MQDRFISDNVGFSDGVLASATGGSGKYLRRGEKNDELVDVESKKIMVTGGSGGLGKGVAEGLLEAGAEVVIIGASERTIRTGEEFRARGLNAHAVRGDLSSEGDLERCFYEALAALGGTVDVLINAAGILLREKSEDYSISDWNAVLSTNLTATFLLAQLAARNMIERKAGGKIINFASGNARALRQTTVRRQAVSRVVTTKSRARCPENDWHKANT